MRELRHTRTPGDRYCASCGAALTSRRPGERPRPGVSGACKLVTLLFVDTVGSTRLITVVDPEVAVARLQPVIDAMTTAVHAFDGPGQVLMTAQTARMAQGFIETEELGLMAVRGLDDPVAGAPAAGADQLRRHLGPPRPARADALRRRRRGAGRGT